MGVSQRIAGIAATLLAAATACGGGGEDRPQAITVDESKPFMQADGPLGAIVIAGDLPRDGELTDARPGYTTTETDVNAFIRLGESVDADSTLTVAWYRRLGDGTRRRLFVHEFRVGPGAWARSQAVARAGLAPGIYETVATLGERQVRTPWIVREKVTRALSAAEQAATDPEDPGPGLTGLDDPSWDTPSAPPGPGPDGPCEITDVSIRAVVELQVGTWWAGRCSTITLAAAGTGAPEVVRTVEAADERIPHAIGTTMLCLLPGGSDLPGAVVRAVVTDSGGASRTTEETLEDLGSLLQVGLETMPAPGSRVEPGDTIKLQAGALLFDPALGIKVLYLNANDELVESVGNASGNSEPRACDLGRLIAFLRTEYRVPPDAPPVIEICANAAGFDGTQADPDCAQFYTGEVWEGTMDGTITIVPPGLPGVVCPNPVRFHGEVRFVVAADGSTTGSVGVTGAEPPCIGSFDLTGEKTEQGISFSSLQPFFTGSQIPIVSPGRAEDEVTHVSGGTTRFVTKWSLRCVSCD